MPIIRIPNPLRPYVDSKAEVQVPGATVEAALDAMLDVYPLFRAHLFKQDGTLRAYVNFFLAGKNIRDLQGLDTHLEPGDVLILVPSIAGG